MEDLNAQLPPVQPAKPDSKPPFLIIGLTFGVLITGLILAFVLMSTRDKSDTQEDLLQANLCPDSLTTMDGKQTAVVKGKNYNMSLEVYEWVQQNCNLTNGETAVDPSTNTPITTNLPDPVVTNLGINFGAYDEMTGRAGAFIFDSNTLKSNIPSNKIFFEFGAQLSTSEGTKTFPEIIYNQVDSDTDITAIADGKVIELEIQQESSDYTVSVLFNDKWVIHYDHILSPQIQMGDQVKAGEIIGKVALNRDGITGFTEIQVKEVIGNKSTSYCPLNFMSANLKAEYSAKLTKLMSDWESFMGNTSIYSEQTQTTAGCMVSSLANE